MIDGRTGLHIWADRVESASGEQSDLRDRIVRETAAHLSPRVLFAEVLRESERREPPRDAYAALMRARAELLANGRLPTLRESVRQHSFGALAAFERDLVKERTMAGLAAAAARGRQGGRRPVVTPSKLERARALLAQGLNVREAATRLKIGKTALYDALANANSS